MSETAFAPQVIDREDHFAALMPDLKRHVVADDFDDDDEVLESHLRAAVSRLDGPDGVLGRAVFTQRVSQQFGCIQEVMLLPYGKATSIEEISYYDQDNELQSVEGELIEMGGGSHVYIPAAKDIRTYDRPNAVTVKYIAGWKNPFELPDAIKQAIRLMAANWYQFREESLIARGGNLEQIPIGVNDLIAPYRRVGL